MVKGIDGQHILTQTYVAEKVQQVQQRQGDLQQRYFDVQLAEDRKLMQEKIRKSEEAEKMKLKDRKNEKDKSDKEKKGHDPDWDSDESDEDKHTIDLKA